MVLTNKFADGEIFIFVLSAILALATEFISTKSTQKMCNLMLDKYYAQLLMYESNSQNTLVLEFIKPD